MRELFWLLCGVWCGVVASLFTWFSLRKHVAVGAFSRQEVSRFAIGMALWIFIPCLILYGLQTSIVGESTPFFLTWPAPQKPIAIALQVFVWVALLYWVFLRDGATTISKYRSATSKASTFLNSPAAVKLLAIAAVVAGVFALLSQNA